MICWCDHNSGSMSTSSIRGHDEKGCQSLAKIQLSVLRNASTNFLAQPMILLEALGSARLAPPLCDPEPLSKFHPG